MSPRLLIPALALAASLSGTGLFAQGAAPAPAPTPETLAAERAAGRQLQLDLENALLRKSPRLVVAPGIYRVSPESPDAPHLQIRKVSNFQLVADGVTLVCETKNSALVLDHCRDVDIRGLTIDYDPLTMTQGTITAVTPTSLDFTIHAGYDNPDYDGIGVGHIWVLDGATRQVRPGSINYGHPRQILPLGGHAYRLVTRSPRRDTVRVGDLIKLPQRLNLKSPHAVRLIDCTELSMENVTIESAPCFAFVSSWGDAIRLTRMRVVPGPPPPGATEPRLFSSSADGIHFDNDLRGPSVRDCLVASSGDDGIATYDAADLVLGAQGSSIVVSLLNYNGSNEMYAPGDSLRFFLAPSHRTAQRTIVSVLPAPAPADLAALRARIPGPRLKRYGRVLRLVLDSPLAVSAGDAVLNARYEGRGFDISNNVLVDNASRGIVVNESHGRVDHNRITHSFLPGIHMTEFLHDGGSPFQTDVQITDNILSDVCVGWPQRQDWQGAISIVASDPAPASLDGHANITIAGNTLGPLNGIGIQVICASSLAIHDNTLGPPRDGGSLAGRVGHAAILLNDVHGADLARNTLTGPGWTDAGAEIQTLPNCAGVSAERLLRPGPSPSP